MMNLICFVGEKPFACITCGFKAATKEILNCHSSFSAKHVALRRNRKDFLTQNQINVSE
jgi:hypothetical protein